MEKIDIKQRIISSGKTQFARYGYNRVTTDDLARELGISKRTLYEYFSSKEKLFEEILDGEMELIKEKIHSIVKSMEENRNESLADQMKNLWGLYSNASSLFTKDFFDDIRKHHPHLWKKIEIFRENQMRENFSKVAKIGVERGVFRESINYDILFLIHLFSVQNLLTPDLLSTMPFTSHEAVSQIFQIMLFGILTEEGRNDFTKIYECKQNNLKGI
jgi:TetR/AcrR family transcriptional regulator, cholesterol catabolism regulator